MHFHNLELFFFHILSIFSFRILRSLSSSYFFLAGVAISDQDKRLNFFHVINCMEFYLNLRFLLETLLVRYPEIAVNVNSY